MLLAQEFPPVPQPESSNEEVPKPRQFGKRKIIIGALLFVGLTAAVFWYQLDQIEVIDTKAIWNGIDWRFGAGILLAIPLEPLATGLRLWVVCRVLHPGLTLWDGVVADSANIGMAMLTPSQTGGGPAQIYMLHSAGISLGTSLTVSLISFFGTLVALLSMGLYSILLGGAGQTAGPLFSAAVWTVTVSVGIMLIAALVPGLFRVPLAACSRLLARARGKTDQLVNWPRTDTDEPGLDRMGPLACAVVDVLYTYRKDAALFLKKGKLAFVGVVVLTGAFFMARCLMAYLAVRFFGIDAGFIEVLEIQVALIFIVYFAPTPGGAGIAEGASFLAMAAIVPAGIAPFYNLLWRFTTGYLQAFAGLLWMMRAIARAARPGTAGPKSTPST